MDARDVALQQSAPVVTVPRYGGFAPLAGNGHRFLVTGDGLWLEARRPWLYLRVPLVSQKSVPMPYGWVGRELPDLWQDSSPSGHRVLPVRARSLPGRVCGMDRVACRLRRDAAGVPDGRIDGMHACALSPTATRRRRASGGRPAFSWSPLGLLLDAGRSGRSRGVQDCRRDRQLRSWAVLDGVSLMRQRAVPAAGIR
jgi:hypothetical protein